MADRTEDLQDIEDRVVKLLLGARELPHGPERQNEMTEHKPALASLGLGEAIRLRWALRDIYANRLKWWPVEPADLRTLIDMGYVVMEDDEPVVTPAGMVEKDTVG